MLDYIYSGKVEVRKEELEDFIKLAQDLQLKGLPDSLATLEEDENGKSIKTNTFYLMNSIQIQYSVVIYCIL